MAAIQAENATIVNALLDQGAQSYIVSKLGESFSSLHMLSSGVVSLLYYSFGFCGAVHVSSFLQLYGFFWSFFFNSMMCVSDVLK
jgi:hypothetical protein